MQKRLAIVNSRAGRLYVASWSLAGQRTFVGSEWIEVADEPVSDETVGTLVRSALAASTTVPYPDFHQGRLPGLRKLLKLAGVRSESQFNRGTREVQIFADEGHPSLLVTPCRNEGPRQGFSEMLDEVITLSADVTDAGLGEAVRAALLLATED